MSRSQTLFHLQQLDTGLDNAQKRIQEINLILQDTTGINEAEETRREKESIHRENSKLLMSAEDAVSLQKSKLDQNQKKLYSGSITNPKELEDLHLESQALNNYLQILEERQLEAMLVHDQSKTELDSASDRLTEITLEREKIHNNLKDEIKRLESEISTLSNKKDRFLEDEKPPDLPVYQSLRKSCGGIAVALMNKASCLSCGSSIPSAIEQEAKSPAKLIFCPTCKRILHPE